MERLRECPFCSGVAILKQTKKNTYKVGCKNVFCFAWIYNTNGEYAPMEEAIKVWNTRHEQHSKAYTPARAERLKGE